MRGLKNRSTCPLAMENLGIEDTIKLYAHEMCTVCRQVIRDKRLLYVCDHNPREERLNPDGSVSPAIVGTPEHYLCETCTIAKARTLDKESKVLGCRIPIKGEGEGGEERLCPGTVIRYIYIDRRGKPKHLNEQGYMCLFCENFRAFEPTIREHEKACARKRSLPDKKRDKNKEPYDFARFVEERIFSR